MDALRGGYGGSIPANYNRYLRPFFFENFANDLVRRLRRRPNMRILELACGTGVVTSMRDARCSDIHISPVELECESESAQAAARGIIEGTAPA